MRKIGGNCAQNLCVEDLRIKGRQLRQRECPAIFICALLMIDV